MELTKENKDYIDSLNIEQLLHKWRFAPVGDPWFQGDTGKYWSDRINLRNQNDDSYVLASKSIGWNNSMIRKITRKEFYQMGEFANTSLFRKHNGKHWEYFKDYSIIWS